jgi:hypothetical protein
VKPASNISRSTNTTSIMNIKRHKYLYFKHISLVCFSGPIVDEPLANSFKICTPFFAHIESYVFISHGLLLNKLAMLISLPLLSKCCLDDHKILIKKLI